MLAADIRAIVSVYSASSISMPHNDSTLYGRKEIEEWHQEYFADFRVVTFAEIERDVEVFDAWAAERWSYMVAIQPIKGGDRIRDDGRFVNLWRKEEDGVWRSAQSLMHSMRPVGSGTSRFFVRLKNRSIR